MIKLNNIHKYFQSKYQLSFILKDINLKINEGEFVTIMGPSGAGKSTLLNIIGLLDDPSEGEHYLYDKPVNNLREKIKTKYHREMIGFNFQAYHLIDELTVYENIETPLLYRNIKGKERKSMVAEMLDRFNIVAKKDLSPHQLSGGQQQIVGVARAIIGNPSLLLADEPTGNLHSKQGEMVMNILKDLHQQGITIIQVTHNEKYAMYSDRIIYLEDGRIFNDTHKEDDGWDAQQISEFGNPMTNMATGS